MSDIFEVLKQEHQQVKDILQQMVETSSQHRQRRKELIGQLEHSLLPHMYAEERYFYELLMEGLEEDQQDAVFEGFEEHRAARFVLSDLESIAFDDIRWHAEASVLQELVKHHIAEEESEIFELARQVIDQSQAANVAEKFEQTKNAQPAEIRL